MKPAWPKLMMPVKPTLSWRPSVKIAYVPASTPTLIQKSAERSASRLTAKTGLISHRPLSATEQPLRPHDQHEDQDREAARDLPARVDHQRRPLLRQPQQQTAGKRAVGVADPAEDHRRKQRQQ